MDDRDDESRRVRGFTQASRTWYFKPAHPDGREEFMIGIYHVDPSDGTEGEFAIRQTKLSDGTHWRLEAFDDSWSVFGEFADFFAMLATLGDDAATEEIRAGLVELGIEDLTKEKRPGSDTPVGTWFCITAAKRYVIENIRSNGAASVLSNWTGTDDEAIAAVQDHPGDSIPLSGCSNRDATGKCMGHPAEEASAKPE